MQTDGIARVELTVLSFDIALINLFLPLSSVTHIQVVVSSNGLFTESGSEAYRMETEFRNLFLWLGEGENLPEPEEDSSDDDENMLDRDARIARSLHLQEMRAG